MSHGSFLTAAGLTLLRSTNQYYSITPESQMHYGHGYGEGAYALDQAAIGVDTHFTYSTDILTQTRMWLQTARHSMYQNVLDRWQIPTNDPMSVNQAFLLATRNGGLALRRPDLGVLAAGATADIVVWDTSSPNMLGWRDPVAAVILHANVGDVEDVMIGGKFVKQNGKLLTSNYTKVVNEFQASAKRIQALWLNTPLPVMTGTFLGDGYDVVTVDPADSLRGPGNGYGTQFLTE
jgi:cytosine/adenosine deaminase-related metal-dependent hydrolase